MMAAQRLRASASGAWRHGRHGRQASKHQPFQPLAGPHLALHHQAAAVGPRRGGRRPRGRLVVRIPPPVGRPLELAAGGRKVRLCRRRQGASLKGAGCCPGTPHPVGCANPASRPTPCGHRAGVAPPRPGSPAAGAPPPWRPRAAGWSARRSGTTCPAPAAAPAGPKGPPPGKARGSMGGAAWQEGSSGTACRGG